MLTDQQIDAEMGPQPRSLVGPDAIKQMLYLARHTPQGVFVEVGVYKGGTAWHLARLAIEQARLIYLFDTFTGIPFQQEIDKQHKVGDFSDTSLEAVRKAIPYAECIQGVFPDSLPKDWNLKHTLPFIAFVHVDADQYKSIMDCINMLWPLMVEGGVMLFDDYRHTSGCKLAVDESFNRRAIHFTEQGKPFVTKHADTR